ncbi:hypothetical protein ACQKNX_07895 [Lysinibacillus sp. NPDC093712]|uniref:hypothetical protein n=1 Tax=Lysinibacillus sp. NPDC093712 TaxID=3390579 RepID=UPI003D026B1E
MKDYELEVCNAIQHDLKKLGHEWELDWIYSFWNEWSEMLSAGWLGYRQGDLEILKRAIDSVYVKIL